MYKGGYMGLVLRVNLTTGDIKKESLDPKIAKDFVGGAGIGINYLVKEVPGDIDPFSEDNKLIFVNGPLTGTSIPCASRMSVVTKSPLTGAVGMSSSGGHFPVELKFAGYDALIIEGKSESPVYIYINDDEVKIKKADGIWGMETFDTQNYIKHSLNNQNIRVACIGPAGENLSRLACIINERRAFGRKGTGAIMGSKNLKAIAVRGTKTVEIADEEEFKKARTRMLGAMKESPLLYSHFSKMGTPMIVDAISALGIFPSENFSTTGEKSYVESIGAEASAQSIVGSEPCYGCPVSCSTIKLARGSSKYVGALSDPEYETYYSFGGVTGVTEHDAIIAADNLCHRLGLDTMSAGVTIAFAMELYEKGILTNDDVGGLDFRFGNHEAMYDALIEMAYRREGIGKLLCDGTKVLSEKIGRDAYKYAMHIKGLELPAYDPRGAKAHGLNYATSYTGADHNRGYAFQEIFAIPIPAAYDRFQLEGKGKLTKWNQDVRTATCDCPTMCAFLLDLALPSIALQNTADLLTALTGVSYDADDVMVVGERVNNLARLFNISTGLTRDDDSMPYRIMNEPLRDGGSKGHYIPKEDLDKMLDDYYTERGWNLSGIPTKEKLMELGLV